MSLPSHAASQWCTNTISAAWVDWAGNLFVNPGWRGDHVRLCNVRTTLADGTGVSIDPTTCVSWLALVRQAMQGNKQTVIQYADAPACNAMPTYLSAPLPSYVMVNN